MSEGRGVDYRDGAEMPCEDRLEADSVACGTGPDEA